MLEIMLHRNNTSLPDYKMKPYLVGILKQALEYFLQHIDRDGFKL